MNEESGAGADSPRQRQSEDGTCSRLMALARNRDRRAQESGRLCAVSGEIVEMVRNKHWKLGSVEYARIVIKEGDGQTCEFSDVVVPRKLVGHVRVGIDGTLRFARTVGGVSALYALEERVNGLRLDDISGVRAVMLAEQGHLGAFALLGFVMLLCLLFGASGAVAADMFAFLMAAWCVWLIVDRLTMDYVGMERELAAGTDSGR